MYSMHVWDCVMCMCGKAGRRQNGGNKMKTKDCCIAFDETEVLHYIVAIIIKT